MRTYIVVATNTEYDLCDRWIKEFDKKDTELVFTGVGPTNTAIGISKILLKSINEPFRVINIGLCGSSIKGAKIYDIIYPRTFLDGDRDSLSEIAKYDLYEEFTEEVTGTRLVSSSKFIENPNIEAYFDMEGFTLKAFSLEYGFQFDCIKIVSDLCSLEQYVTIDIEVLYEKFKEALNGF